MRRIFTFFLALTVGAGTLFAADIDSGTCGAEGDNVTWSITSSGNLTISGEGAMADWTTGEPPWAPYRATMNSVRLNTGVTTIGSRAFENCEKLTYLTIYSNSGLTTIGDRAFSGCSSLNASISIPSTVTSIGEDVFYGCTSLTTISVNSSNPNYYATGNVLFNKAKTKLICFPAGKKGTYSVPSTVTDIGVHAFAKCAGLTAVTISKAVTQIAEDAFEGCTGLTTFTVDANNTAFSALYDVLFDKEAKTLVRYASDKKGPYIIPNSVDSIGAYAFEMCTGLTSINIPASVKQLGRNAFDGCSRLNYIICKATNPPVCYSKCFNGVSRALPVYVPAESVAAYKDAPGWKDFNNIQALDIIASGTCGAQGDNLMWELSGSGVLTISGTGEMKDYDGAEESYAPWYSHNADIKSIEIGSGVTGIGGEAFRGCKSISSFIIPNTVTRIGDAAFFDCIKLISITIPKSVTSIGDYAFVGCSGMHSIDVEDGNSKYRSLYGVLFDKKGTSNLKVLLRFPAGKEGSYTYVIPQTVTSIGEYAFQHCTGMNSVFISKNVTSIEWNAFDGCTGLTSITCEATTPPDCGNGKDRFDKVDKDIPVYVPEGAVEAYKVAPGWSDFTNIQSKCLIASGNCGVTISGSADHLKWELSCDSVLTIFGFGEMKDVSTSSWKYNGTEYKSAIKSIVIHEGATNIGEYMFSYLDSLTSVTIPNSVTAIERSAFSTCPKLTSVTIPNSVTAIGDKAFYNCTGLTSIEIPNSVTSLGNSAFYECAGLTDVKLSNSLTSIGSNTFYYCTALPSITIPNSVTAIGDKAFYNCTGLTSIEIPNSVTSLGTEVFEHCTGLTSVTLGKGLTDIGEKDFTDCTGLISVTIPGNVTSIGYAAFSSCTSLTDLTIETGVTNIERYAFLMCSSLTAVTIPNSVTNIDADVFRLCTSLTSIEIPNSVTSIGGSAFYNCTGLTTVTLGEGITSLGGDVFSGCSGITMIICEAVEPPACGTSTFQGVTKYIPLYVPAESIDKYKAHDVWKYFSIHAIPKVDSGTCGDNLTWNFGLGVLIISGTGEMTNWTKAADVPWAAYKEFITQIKIEEGVTSIGQYAFDNCDYVSSIPLPSSIETIGGSAFSGCDKLESMKIPNSVTSLGNYAFMDCKNLKTVTIGNGVKSVGYSAFEGCTSLNAVHISDLVAWCKIKFATYPGNPLVSAHNLYMDGKLVTDLVLPNNVSSIERSVFYGCTCFTSITFSKRVYSIDWYAFEGCSNVQTIMCHAVNPPDVGYRAFEGVNRETTILYVPEGSVDKYKNDEKWGEFKNIKAFPATSGACGDNLTWNLDEDGVLTISGEGAMANYTSASPAPWSLYFASINTVVLERGVSSIGNYAFNGCSHIQLITCYAPEPPTCGNNCFDNVDKESAVVYVPKGTVAQYQLATGWNEFKHIEVNPLIAAGTCGAEGDNLTWTLNRDGVLTITGDGDMADNVSSWIPYRADILSVVIESGATSIGQQVFADCKNMTTVTIPKSVTAVGNAAFRDCSSLSAVAFPNGIAIIRTATFSGCSALTEFVIPNTVTEIGRSAFAGCTALSAITVPNNVTKIGETAFSDCTALTSLTSQCDVPPTCGADCFLNVDKSIPLYVPEDALEDYKNAPQWKDFTNRKGVRCVLAEGTLVRNDKITWSLSCSGKLFIEGTGNTYPVTDFPTEVEWEDYIYSVKSLIIGEGVTGIGVQNFYYHENLESISLPQSLTYIDGGAFGVCRSLTSVAIPNHVTLIGAKAFAHCDALSTIVLGYGLKDIHENAFTAFSSITCFAVKPPTAGGAFGGISPEVAQSIPVYVPDQSVSLYKAQKTTNEWKQFKILPLSARPGTHIIASGTCGSGLTWTLDSNGVLTIKGTGAMDSWGKPNPAGAGKRNMPADDASAPWYPYHSEILYVEIEEGVESIGDNAFNGCTNIQSITCYAVEPPTCGTDAFGGIDPSGLLSVPEGSIPAYQTANQWQDFLEIQAIEQDTEDIPTILTNDAQPATKILYKGQIFILRGEKAYTLTGQEVK